MRRNILTTIVMAIAAMQIPLTGFSQFSISGTVTDAETGEPLAGTNIVVDETGPATATGADGTYSFSDISAGKHKLRFSFIGFKTKVRTVELKADFRLDVTMQKKAIMSDEVIVSATRTGEDSPSTYSTLGEEKIEKFNTGQDLPYILQLTPSVVTTSDAGTGIGYTGIRIRGTDISRINVTMNGVPVNDAESHGVFFVDLPDLASSVENIQIQRGVGTSTNGSAAFGGSINIKTTGLNPDPYGGINSAAGSFNTFKNTLRFGSGLINGKWAFDGRLSSITSDGYIDRGRSDLKSFYTSGGYYSDNTIVKAIITSGWEQTYQAWNGVPKDSLETNRTYNPSGAMYDEDGNIIGFYDNETDNYQQDYYQLHIAQRLNARLNATASLFYTHGKGYYENFRNKNSFAEYGFEDVIIGGDTLTKSDMVRQKWLNNDFYGFNLALNYSTSKLKATLGGGWNTYKGDHYGYIIWAEHASNSFIDKPWYDNTGDKTDYNVFLKANYRLLPDLNLYGDLQIRSIDYAIEGTHDDLRDLTQSHDFFFFNPKAGLVVDLSGESEIYASVAVAHREPPRGVYRDADPGQRISAERLNDYELGYRHRNRWLQAEANFYYMDYKDQLVLTGEINNVGDDIMVNVPGSFRTGIEVAGSIQIWEQLRWEVNATLSRNKITDFVYKTHNFSADWSRLPGVVDTLGTTDISFSPDVIAAGNLVWEPFDNFEASLVSRYVGRQYIDNTSSRERSLDPYFVNDLRFDYSFNPGLFKSVAFFLSLQNIFNVEYITNAWVYPYYYEGVLYEDFGYYPQATFNFIGGVNLAF